MTLRCAICVLSGKSPEGPLMPHTVIYRGYSLCDDHLHLWEENREVEWEEIVRLAGRPVVLRVEMPDDATVEEKQELIEEAVSEFNIKDYQGVALPISTPEEFIPTSVLEDMDNLTDPVTDVMDRAQSWTDEEIDFVEKVGGYPPAVEVKAVEPDGTETVLEPGDVLSTNPKKDWASEAKDKRRRRKKTYHCTKCGTRHSHKSNKGKKHKEFSA